MACFRATWCGGSVAAVALGSLLLSGCGGRGYEGPQRAAVAGTVTLDGAPVQNGVINLLGQQRKASATIDGGGYDIPEAKGPNLGVCRVEILWRRPTGRKVSDPDIRGRMFDETVEAIPAKYNTQTTLQVEITPGQNRHDFQLTAK